MDQSVSEPELIASARAGSADAFCDLVRMHQSAVRGYVTRYLRGRDVIDDVAQETFLACYHSLETFPGTALRFWLLGIARRRVALYLRDELRRRAHEMGALEVELLRRQAALVEGNEPLLPYDQRKMAALRECLKRLSAGDADLLRSCYVRAETSAQLAERTGRTDSAVRMSLMRLRQALRACVQSRVATSGAERT